jgi:hypothetical protein
LEAVVEAVLMKEVKTGLLVEVEVGLAAMAESLAPEGLVLLGIMDMVGMLLAPPHII